MRASTAQPRRCAGASQLGGWGVVLMQQPACRCAKDQRVLVCAPDSSVLGLVLTPVLVLLLLQAMIHLAPLPGGGIGGADVDVPAAVAQLATQQQHERLDFLGPLLPPEVARGIAEGVARWRILSSCRSHSRCHCLVFFASVSQCPWACA